MICVGMVLVSAACLPAAAELGKQSAVFKGHQLDAFVADAQTGQVTIELDNRSIAVQEGVAEISKINTTDLQTSFLFSLHLKTAAGCGSYIFVRVPLNDSGKSELLSDFGACNDKLSTRLETRQRWSAWYAFAFRDDRASAQVALIHDNKLTIQEVKARPCLFAPVVQANCFDSLIAEAMGSGELGSPTGEGTFANQKVETFINRATGKATVKLNGSIFHTFDDAKEFYLDSVDGEDQFGLFAFFLTPTTGCSTRPLVFFAKRESEPQAILDYAPCTDRLLRITRKKAGAIEWSGIAYHLGEPGSYVASVIDHKISTHTGLLPACMMQANTAQERSCTLQALNAAAAAPASKSPRVEAIPAPPSAAPSAPPSVIRKPSHEMLRGI